MKNFVYCFFMMFLVSCSSTAQTSQESRFPWFSSSFVISVQADLVSAIHGCYTVNVRVYLTMEGQTNLVANSNVQVGDCTQRLGNNDNVDCPDKEFKGDYFFYTKDKYKYCLVDMLEDETIYAKYVIEKNKVIDSVKK